MFTYNGAIVLVAAITVTVSLVALLGKVQRWVRAMMRRQHERFLLRYLAALSQSYEGRVVIRMLDNGSIPYRMLHVNAPTERTSLDMSDIIASLRQECRIESRELRHCVRQVTRSLSWLWHFYDPRAAKLWGCSALDTQSHPTALLMWLERFMPDPQDHRGRNDMLVHVWVYLDTEVTSVERRGLKELIQTGTTSSGCHPALRMMSWGARQQQMKLWEDMGGRVELALRRRRHGGKRDDKTTEEEKDL